MSDRRDTDWLGAIEAWIGLILASMAWHELLFPSMMRWSETTPVDFRSPAYLEHFQYLAVLDGIAFGLAIAGIRFAPGVSRWAAVLTEALGAAMFCLFLGF